ncbi:hypothetical protein [Kamptonema formosum]|uniref:hypothetical protein n=1 Tax=Kamptonema formosum TaxID=331992 RepID=UPI0012DD3FDE|nr:hypothetical protein [Oscillatoria sp. PCC 10802]
MANSSSKVLRMNPFTTYRDPVTGKWLVVPMGNSGGEPSPARHLEKPARAIIEQGAIDSFVRSQASSQHISQHAPAH